MAETETDRKRRLAEALRANLRRRKAQGRAQAAGDRPEDGVSDGASADKETGRF